MHLVTPRLTIGDLRLEHLDDFHAYRSNPEVTRYQGFDVMTHDEARDFIAANAERSFGVPGEWVQYAIARTETGTLVGDCAIKLNVDEPRIADVGVTISHLAQRNGYAKESVVALVAFLFGARELHRIVAVADAENVASLALFRGAGFRQEGHFVENVFFKGKWGSEIQLAILRREWTSAGA
jgi:ribosomal-protein-alanine N-acetyltransferase